MCAHYLKQGKEKGEVTIPGGQANDVCTQGHSFGKWLLNDVVLRISNLADQVGIKAIMVHAIDDKARAFYEYFVMGGTRRGL